MTGGLETAVESSRPVAYISIGNSDNKLPQQRWSTFATFVRRAVTQAAREPGGEILFEGYSLPNAPYQNACWALALPYDQTAVAQLKADLADLGGHFDQDSVGYAVAPVTEFLGHPKAAEQAA